MQQTNSIFVLVGVLQQTTLWTNVANKRYEQTSCSVLCDRVQEFKSSVAAVVEGSLYHHHRVIGFMVIGFMVFTQRFRDSFLGDARLRFRGILRFILHLLRVKPLTSYKSSCSSSSHTINYSESCHSLQRVMPLTTASHATNYSESCH